MSVQDVTMIVRHVLTVLLDTPTKQQLQLAALQTALHFSPDAIADRSAVIMCSGNSLPGLKRASYPYWLKWKHSLFVQDLPSRSGLAMMQIFRGLRSQN